MQTVIGQAQLVTIIWQVLETILDSSQELQRRSIVLPQDQRLSQAHGIKSRFRINLSRAAQLPHGFLIQAFVQKQKTEIVVRFGRAWRDPYSMLQHNLRRVRLSSFEQRLG